MNGDSTSNEDENNKFKMSELFPKIKVSFAAETEKKSGNERKDTTLHNNGNEMVLSVDERRLSVNVVQKLRESKERARRSLDKQRKLIANHNVVREIFYKAAFLTIFTNQSHITTQLDHARLLAALFRDTVQDLDKPSAPIMERYFHIGRHHAFLQASGFSPEIWEHFGEIAVEVLTMQECVKTSQDASKSWAAVAACMTDQMRHGFESQCRELQRNRAAQDNHESLKPPGARQRARSVDTDDQNNKTPVSRSTSGPGPGPACSRPTTLSPGGNVSRRRATSVELDHPFPVVDSANLNLDSLLNTHKNPENGFAKFGAELKVGVSPSGPAIPSLPKNHEKESSVELQGLKYFDKTPFPRSSCVHCGNPVTSANDLRIHYSSASYLEKVLAEDLCLDSIPDFQYSRSKKSCPIRDHKPKKLVIPEIIIHVPVDD